MDIFILNHEYGYDLENGTINIEAKGIGAYSSLEKVQEVISRYKTIQGFRRFPIECFKCYEYELNQSHWTDGFDIQNDEKTVGFISEKKHKGKQ